jgi:hypothetical protein
MNTDKETERVKSRRSGTWQNSYPTTAPAFVNAASNSSLLKSVLRKSSCPALSFRANL